MNFKSLHLLALVLLLGLAAFRPWRSVNRAVGLPNLADSVSIAGQLADSVLVTQPIQVVLPPSTVDSLAAVVADKEQTKAELKAKNRKLDNELASLKKSNAEKQSSLVSEQEIQHLLAKQNQKRPAAPDRSTDADSPVPK